jgi:CheY-like chemotaxis protein
VSRRGLSAKACAAHRGGDARRATRQTANSYRGRRSPAPGRASADELAHTRLTASKPRVLLVDDNPGDVQLTRIAFEESGFRVDLTAATSVKEAKRLLRADDARFDLVLLDLNLPDAPGHDLLAYCKQCPLLASLPVVVVSTSDYSRDRQRAADLGAVGYIVKPNSFTRFLELLQQLRPWLQ